MTTTKIKPSELIPMVGKKAKAKVKWYSYHEHLTPIDGTIAFANDDFAQPVGIRSANEWFNWEDIYEITIEIKVQS